MRRIPKCRVPRPKHVPRTRAAKVRPHPVVRIAQGQRKGLRTIVHAGQHLPLKMGRRGIPLQIAQEPGPVVPPLVLRVQQDQRNCRIRMRQPQDLLAIQQFEDIAKHHRIELSRPQCLLQFLDTSRSAGMIARARMPHVVRRGLPMQEGFPGILRHPARTQGPAQPVIERIETAIRVRMIDQ